MLSNTLIKAQIKSTHALEGMSRKMMAKKAGDENLITKIILMVVAVVLCILFRDTLKSIITTLLNSVQSNVSGMFS